MSYVYNIDYINENEYRKMERSIKKYNMLAYKKLMFDYYPSMKEGNFLGTLVSKKAGVLKYELKLPTDSMFQKIHGDITVHYQVYEKEKIIMLDTISPEDLLAEGLTKELTTYKGVMVSKSHKEKDIFKINLLNMIQK